MHYCLDGELQAVQGDKYYPETPMSINFNLWFINEGLLDSSIPRAYDQNVDWMLFVQDDILTPEQIVNQVEQLRTDQWVYLDTTRQLVSLHIAVIKTRQKKAPLERPEPFLAHCVVLIKINY